jgi:hypothetical protein
VASKADEYRRRARQCLEMAGTFREREARVSLSYMAEVWLRLADAVGREATNAATISAATADSAKGRRQRVGPLGSQRLGARNENPAQGMGIRAPTERGSEIPRGTLGWGVGGTPEGVYEGMPFIGTLQARASR